MATPLPTDTLFSQQWFLYNGAVGEYDLNVREVWAEFTGAGKRVMVIDDGFEHTHSDLSPNYDITLDHDYGAGDDDAAPFFTTGGRDNHGTAVMGIIGAAKNDTGVVGVAYDATLIGARITYGVTTNAWTANLTAALGDAVLKDADVVNMSFGGSGDFDSYTGAANLVLENAAIIAALAEGRGGLGLALVKSAGNSRASSIDVNHNQTDNNTGEIIVAAVNRDGFVSNYSSYGSAILVAGIGSPSDGGGGEIVTTDRLGSAGYDAGDFDTGFNGTSAAAPMVSGVVTLMLQANEDLGWRDIQTILANTARHVGSVVDGITLAGSEQNAWNWNAASNWNGGGMHFSRDYGYGLVDALAAVRLAESWTAKSISANEKSATVDLLDQMTVIADGDPAGHVFSAKMKGNIQIERVTVTLDFTADKTNDLDVYLVGPDGLKQLLAADQGFNSSYNGAFTYHSQAYRGQLSGGNWQVQVVDDTAGNVLSVSDITIKAYGTAPSKKDTYVYTNEFSDFLDGHSKNLKDRDGGTDILNAAAVTDAMTINLGKGRATIDGIAMRVSGIEDIFGGDGADKLFGNRAGNDIAGGRGVDTLTGGRGNDHFIFRTVTDSLSTAFDLIKDFSKGDRIDLRDIDSTDADGDQKFKFIGSQDFHATMGELRIEVIDHKGARHDLTYVEADLNADGLAEFVIELSGLHRLKAGDFML